MIAIVGLLVGLILPAVQSARESARNATCSNNIRQLARAALAYHQANNAFPVAQSSDKTLRVPGFSTYNRSVSVHVWLLPFLERMDLYRSVIDLGTGSTSQVAVVGFLCPSDNDRMTRTDPASFNSSVDLNLVGCGRNNYKANRGNNKSYVSANGVFIPQAYEGAISLGHITAGASQTGMFAECCLGDGDSMSLDPKTDIFVNGSGTTDYDQCLNAPVVATGYSSQLSFMGRNWVWGEPAETLYMHVMPPNGKSCFVNSTDQFLPHYDAAITASSRHAGGANVALCDGSTRFVKDAIDITIWQALGSRTQKGEPVIPDSW